VDSLMMILMKIVRMVLAF